MQQRISVTYSAPIEKLINGITTNTVNGFSVEFKKPFHFDMILSRLENPSPSPRELEFSQ